MEKFQQKLQLIFTFHYRKKTIQHTSFLIKYFFFYIDYRNCITNYVPIALQEQILDVAELQFPSIAWKQKVKRKRQELEGAGQPLRYCAIDQTHPIPIQA